VEDTSTRPFLARHEFLIRRLHSLSGLVPVGAYLCIHLVTNASVLSGPEFFQRNVDLIHSLGRALPIVEWTFIFIPLLFHAIIGVMMIGGMVPNTGSYPYKNNIRYTLQRATGMIAFAFIVWHVIQMHHFFGAPFQEVRVFPLPTGGAAFDPHAATSSAAAAVQASVAVFILYLIGVLACVYHLANGLWTMGITWGVWTTEAAQRRANWLALAFGIVLGAVGISAGVGIFTTDIQEARASEQAAAEQREELERKKQELLKRQVTRGS
jgi:succinate dehydrogenase / fumarate reductase cytochrome b subunit